MLKTMPVGSLFIGSVRHESLSASSDSSTGRPVKYLLGPRDNLILKERVKFYKVCTESTHADNEIPKLCRSLLCGQIITFVFNIPLDLITVIIPEKCLNKIDK